MNRRADRNRASLRLARPTLEGLEERKLLYATTGGAWTYPQRVTYSFMPDGTYMDSSNNYPSDLQANLNAQYPGWQTAFQNAASIWQAVAGVNLVQVPDNGARAGSTGYQQGDPNFGDIRIGGFNMSAALGMNGTLAEAYYPPPLNTGTIAGDIVVNDGQNWNYTSGYDLETVAIHEFGHALGLDHSAISTAVMYAYYNGTKQTLTSDDISGIQSIYGAWPAIPNTYYTTGTNITPNLDSNNQIALAGLEIPLGKNAWFYVTAPSNTTSTMTVTMQTTGLSSLLPAFSVYTTTGVDQKPTGGAGYGQSSVYGSTISTTIKNVVPGETFAIRTLSSNWNGSYGSAGGYALLVNLGTQTQSLVPPPNTTQATPPYFTTTSSSAISTSDGNGHSNDAGDPKKNRFHHASPQMHDHEHWINIGTSGGYGDELTIDPSLFPSKLEPIVTPSAVPSIAPDFGSYLAVALPSTGADAALIGPDWGARPFDAFLKTDKHRLN